jgi:hypothetical protein
MFEYLNTSTQQRQAQMSRVFAQIVLSSRHLSLEAIQKYVNIKPHRSWNRGEAINQYILKSPCTDWILNSINECQTPDINDHFLWLDNQLKSSKKGILKLMSKHKEEMEEICFGVMFRAPVSEQEIGPWLNSASLQMIADYKGALSVDLAFQSEE